MPTSLSNRKRCVSMLFTVSYGWKSSLNLCLIYLRIFPLSPANLAWNKLPDCRSTKRCR